MEITTITSLKSEILRKASKPVPLIDVPKIKNFITEMEEVMRVRDGLGIAAPQVGKNIRVVIINTKDGALAMINPKILKKSWKKNIDEEGCLSVPRVFGLVKRHNAIFVSAIDKDAKNITFEAKGLFARVIQHEIDHLDGILFIDKVTKITRGKGLLKEMESAMNKK
ncbi:MAG: Peptide deformylase [Parcubacteria group bacterium GW2011_GWA2_38_13]|nr:MAG: Peptide deformylase [Parcubacteria group bacterium GW2011_GWA2_38_13]